MPGWWPFSRAKASAGAPASFASMMLASNASRTAKRSAGELLLAYNGHPWLRQVVNRIGTSVASVPWEAFRASGPRAKRLMAMPRTTRAGDEIRRKLIATGDLEPLESHEILDVIERGNGAMPGVMLRQLVTMQVDLAGESFWVIEPDGAGQVRALYPLSPAWVREVPKLGDTAGRYIVRMPGSAVETEFPPSLVTWIRDVAPGDPYGRGIGFAASLDDEIDADQSAARHVRAFFVNGAIPPLVGFLEGAAPEEVAAFKERWFSQVQGERNRNRPLFTNRKFELRELSAKFADMDLVELRRFFADTVQRVYGVPPEILGVIESSNRATIDAADTIFAKHVLVPRLDRLRVAYQQIADMRGDGVVVDYVSPVPSDRDHALKVMTAAPFAFTVDEWRESGGAEPIEGDEGKVRFMPSKWSEVGSEVEAQDDAQSAEDEPAADPPLEDEGDDAEKSADVISMEMHRVALVVAGAVGPGVMRHALGDAVGAASQVRRINARTRKELTAAIVRGDDAATAIARIFDHAKDARARGIAKKSGASRIALREAFAHQERAALEALRAAIARAAS